MKKGLQFLLCAAIILLQNPPLKAAHIVGGEMTYQCLGNDNYLLTLKVYRDCAGLGAAFDNPAYVFVYDVNGTIVQTLSIFNPDIITLPNDANNPCLIIPPGICIEQAIYTFTANFPSATGGYSLVYQRCCRNITIDNLVAPDATGATYLGFIPDPTIAECNSSPYFNNFPPTVICVDQPLVFDHSATDPDGDSLVYQLCAPYLGATSAFPQPAPGSEPPPPPYAFVTFLSPYSPTDPMGGAPPMAIDPNTGLLTVTPTTIGQFVVGVCVSEYRNGELVSEHKRDFQFNVTTCQPAVLALTPNVVNNCSSNTVTFENNSSGGSTYHWDFGVIGATNDTSNVFSPTYTFPDTGVYIVTLIVNPGTTCGDTTTATVYIYPTLNPAISAPDGCVGQPVQFADQTSSTYGVVDSWSWNFDDGNTSTTENPSNIFTTAGDYDVQLVVGNSVGCADTVVQSVTIFPAPTIQANPDDTVICYLDAVQLFSSANGATNYSWQPDYNLSSPNTANPLAGPDVTVTYTVTVSNSFGCSAQDSVHIEVFDTILAFAGDDTTICPGGAVQLNATGGINFNWAPGAGLNNTTIPNPVATPAVTTTYFLTTSVGSCVGTDTVTIFVKPFPIITAGPDVGICEGDSVTITASGGTSYSWFPSNTLNDATLESPIAFPSVTTTYIVSGTNVNDCPIVVEDSLIVSVIPAPSIFITPDTSIILGTYIVLTVTGGSSYVWSPSAGLDNSTSPTPIAAPTETTTYTVTITTADGCVYVDSVTIIVTLEPLLIFPTAFSPNGDGKNDLFRPVILGLAHLDEFRIFNRWGEELFADNNVDVIGGPLPDDLSWDGKYKGQQQPLGVYVYFLKGVGAATGTSITRQGNFTLVR